MYALPTEEKKLRSQTLIDFAELQGYEEDQLKRLADILARAKDVDEAIREFRHMNETKENVKFHVVKGEAELLQRLDAGWSLVQNLNEDKFLLKKPSFSSSATIKVS